MSLASSIGTWDRAIVAKRVGIIAGIPVVLTILTAFHVHVPWTSDAIQNEVVAVLDALGLLVGIGVAAPAVTPADLRLGPVSKTGEPLVPASSGDPLPDEPAPVGPSQDINPPIDYMPSGPDPAAPAAAADPAAPVAPEGA